MRELLRDLLEAEGYEVSVADNAHSALRALQSAQFDLLVTDQMMPDETGAWLLRQAEAIGVLDRLRAVMVTANAHFDRIDRPPNVPVFRKPFDFDRFLDTLKELGPRDA